MSALRTTLPLLVLYFVSSSSLLVLNKVAIKAIPNASLLLFTQLGSTVVIVAAPALVGKARINFKPEGKVVRAYSTVAVVFLATIYSNFQVIHSIGINPFVVLRCSTPLMVSILDWAFMGRTLPDWKSALALSGILSSGSMYARLKIADPGFDANGTGDANSGLWWSAIWLVSFLLDMVYIKYVVEAYPCSGSERTLYQNFLALPILVVLLNVGAEKHSVLEAANAPQSAWLAVVLTCFAGAALSFTGMSLRTELSATLFTVLGIVCKMASTLLNEIFVEPERDLARLACIAAVIISSSFYKQAPLK
jgi:solute carrier family 35